MKLRSGRALGHHTESDHVRDRHDSHYLPNSVRQSDATCASGDKCVSDPPSRVEIRGEQCGACLRVQREMRARLRARR